jgi:hypothetical protein
MTGTRRTPIIRQHTSSLAAVLPHYRHACTLTVRWERSRSDADYAAMIEAQKVCDRMLLGSRRLWEISVFDIGPIYDRSTLPEDERMQASWQRAVETLEALELLDREERRRQRAARRAAKAGSEPEPAGGPEVA